MGDSVNFRRGRNDGFVVIPFKDFHLYKIASLLCRWQYVVISDFVADESVQQSSNPGWALEGCIKKTMYFEFFLGNRGGGGPGQMFNLNGFENDVGVLIWHLGTRVAGRAADPAMRCRLGQGHRAAPGSVQRGNLAIVRVLLPHMDNHRNTYENI